jgi:hypothetical protein
MVMKNPIMWDITPFLPLKSNRRFRGTCRIHVRGRRISQASIHREASGKQVHSNLLFGLLLGLKMEETCSSKTSIDFQWTTRRYIPENRTLHVFLYLY